jgi:hypothetical protein
MGDRLMSVDPDRVHRALADQLRANVSAGVTVYPWPASNPVWPALQVIPEGDYLGYFQSMGPDGSADMRVRIRIEVDAVDDESVFVKMCRYLAAGTGHESSVPNAVLVDRTLGGCVADAVPLIAEWPNPEAEPHVAYVPVQIILNKEGVG